MEKIIHGWQLFFNAFYYWWIVITNQDDKYGSYRCDTFHAMNYGWDLEHYVSDQHIDESEIDELMKLFEAKYGTKS